MARTLIRRFLQVLVNRGPWGFCKLAAQKVGQRLGLVKAPKALEAAAAKGGVGVAVHPFDEDYGTDTSGLLWGADLSSGKRNDLWNTAYYGVTPSLLTQMIGALELEWERYTFIDLGSGKGRALLLASRFPFKKIIGVEFVPELSRAAEANLAKFDAPWKRCLQIEAVNQDATEFVYPDGPLVVYVYNPFLAPVLKKCLKQLARSVEKEPREVYLIYGNPVFERLVSKHAPRFVRQWERVFSFTEAEAEADRFGARSERVILWKYAGGNESHG
ncbi:MAG: class I SAM-dependent methyltransferase [Acidobacteria bacterium]|nr:class I SAM-dependent methyltransferase [Acidobacteriota bacterium]